MDYQGALTKSGLWMPNRHSMYEDDMVAQWYDDSVHGDSYKLMLDYFENAVVRPDCHAEVYTGKRHPCRRDRYVL